jgi:hypothetical protein
MPNILGGDQYDKDYAPHLYDADGQFVGNKPALDRDTVLSGDEGAPALSAIKNPKIRVEVRDYRVVAPKGQTRSGRFFVNDPLVIERKSKDALGVEGWSHVTTINAPGKDCKDEVELAFYWLLAGPGAE